MGDNLIDIGLGTSFIAISVDCGVYHSCALSSDAGLSSILSYCDFAFVVFIFFLSEIKCWGRGFYGQLGLGDNENRGDDADDFLDAISLGTGFNVTSLHVGGDHGCALSTEHGTFSMQHRLYSLCSTMHI